MHCLVGDGSGLQSYRSLHFLSNFLLEQLQNNADVLMTPLPNQTTNKPIRHNIMSITNIMRSKYLFLSYDWVKTPATDSPVRFEIHQRPAFERAECRAGNRYLQHQVSVLKRPANVIALTITQLQKQHRQLRRPGRQTKTGRSIEVKSKISACTCHIGLVA